jgi:alpha-glucoside transport system permease protein
MALVAIIWGVGGVALLFVISNWVVERLSLRWRSYLQPFVFVGPGLAILTWYLFLPTVRTLYYSFFNRTSTKFIGFNNFVFALTDKAMVESFRNNLLWLIVGTSFSVMFGLLIAILADRSKFEKLAKSIIFLPNAISFVGAGVSGVLSITINPQEKNKLVCLMRLLLLWVDSRLPGSPNAHGILFS